MKKIKTLKKNYEFKNVLSNKNFYIGKYITIYCKPNKKNENYIGIAVNVHIAKAVKRNKIKRLIRENYRLLKNDLKNGNDILFMWNKNSDIKDATFKNINKDMINILKKIGLLENEKNNNNVNKNI